MKLDGGAHAFQRDLWRAVAELNFCSYWAQEYTATETKHLWSKAGTSLGTKTTEVKRHRHNLIGRIVNTRMTTAMATYLLEAIERVLRERLNGAPAGSNWAWSFRKGAASTLVGKLYDRRAEYIAEENEKVRRAAASKFKFVDEKGTEWRYGKASRSSGARDTSINADAYDDGRQAAEDIGLDTQVAHAPQGRLA